MVPTQYMVQFRAGCLPECPNRFSTQSGPGTDSWVGIGQVGLRFGFGLALQLGLRVRYRSGRGSIEMLNSCILQLISPSIGISLLDKLASHILCNHFYKAPFSICQQNRQYANDTVLISVIINEYSILLYLSKYFVYNYRFPKDKELRSKWEQYTGRKDWHATNNHMLCSTHFTPNCFYLSGDRTHLIRGQIKYYSCQKLVLLLLLINRMIDLIDHIAN